MVGQGTRHIEPRFDDVRGVARINPLNKVFELRNPSIDVGQDISTRIEHVRVSDVPGYSLLPTSMKRKALFKRRQLLQTVTSDSNFETQSARVFTY